MAIESISLVVVDEIRCNSFSGANTPITPDNYFLMKVRSYIVPAVQVSSRVAPLLFFGGYIFSAPHVAWAGVLLFGGNTLSLC